VILGVGTDIVCIGRMRNSLERFGERFAGRILDAGELAEYREDRFPERLLAKRFAVKEAVAKALGTGFRDGVTPRQIAVVHDQLGKPAVRYAGPARRVSDALGVGTTLVSVSDERDHAIAFVLLLRG